MNSILGYVLRILPDKAYIMLKYYYHFGKLPNLKKPKTFNEKLQWLKLHDRNPKYIAMVDKYLVKQYVADIIGEEYIIPTLGKWDHFNDIDFDKLPNQFVLKCNHDCGSVVIVRDKNNFDKVAAKKKLERNLRRNYFWEAREWPYKNIKPCIFAEKYMEDSSTKELRDYKIFTFNGVAKALFVATDRQKEGEEVKFDFFDMSFKHLPFKQGHENADIEPQKPVTFTKMVELAEKLSEGIPLVRVDFYEVNGKTYFGELTFSHFGGIVPFKPEIWDKKFGKLVTIPDENGGGYAIICNGFVLWLHEEQSRADGLVDYKVFCFDGVAKLILTVEGGHQDESKTVRRLHDIDWNLLPVGMNGREAVEDNDEKPVLLNKIINLAETVSKNIKHLRVDFYIVDGKIYFGELTFYWNAGFSNFVPIEKDKELGNLMNIETEG